MQNLSDIKAAIARALALAPKDGIGALRILEDALENARAAGEAQRVRMLATVAGTVCSGFVDARKALGFYDEAIGISPDHAYLHFACGELYHHLGERDEAEQAYRRFIDCASDENDMNLIEVARRKLSLVSDNPEKL